MKSLFLAAALSLAASAAVAQTCAPATLTKVVTRSVGPDIVRGSFRAEPITLYRQGSRFLRMEEAADPEQKLHLLSVVAEPDVWVVNRMDMTGRHMVDPGPVFNAHAPIVTGTGVPALFAELEFGCEAQFTRTRAREAGTRPVQGKSARIYALQQGDRRLEVLLSDAGTPVEVAYYEGAKAALVIRYDLFQTGLPDDPALFRKPEGVTFSGEAGR